MEPQDTGVHFKFMSGHLVADAPDVVPYPIRIAPVKGGNRWFRVQSSIRPPLLRGQLKSNGRRSRPGPGVNSSLRLG
jgi:hypothetical protein